MVALYLLAEKLDCYLLCDMAIQKAAFTGFQLKGLLLDPTILKNVYTKTEKHSSLRKFIVDCWVWEHNAADLTVIDATICLHTPRAWLSEVIRALGEKTGAKPIRRHESPYIFFRPENYRYVHNFDLTDDDERIEISDDDEPRTRATTDGLFTRQNSQS